MFPPPSRSTAVFHTNFVWLLNTCVCVCVPGINERAVQVGNFVRIFRDFWISRWAVHDLSLIIGYSDDGLWDDDDVVFYYLGIYALLGVVIIVFTGTRTIIIQVWPSDPLTPDFQVLPGTPLTLARVPLTLPIVGTLVGTLGTLLTYPNSTP